MDKLTPEDLAVFQAEYNAWLDANEPSPVDPDRLTARVGEKPTKADRDTARGFWAEVERLRALDRKAAG